MFQSCLYRMHEAIPAEARGRASADFSDVRTGVLTLFGALQIFGWKTQTRPFVMFSFEVMARQMLR